MGLTDLLFKRQRLQVGTQFPTMGFPLPALVEFDASISESHNDEAEVTEHPIEEGSNISDHFRKLPVYLTLEGMITNTPIVFLASLTPNSPIVGDFKPTWDRVETAYAKLREFQTAGVLVDVITSLRTYANMALISVGVVREASTGNALHVSMTLREVKIANSLSIDQPIPVEKANKKKKNEGQKNTQAAGSSQEATSTSLLMSLLGG
jgi:hypothetical protein